MSSNQDLVVEITAVLGRDGVDIGLSTDLDTLVIGEVDVFTKELALRGHKYRAGKAASIAIDVAALAIVIAVVSILCVNASF